MLNRILQEIRSNGPIDIDRYMEVCLSHYYNSRDPFGKDGDFVTAPEICQIFGEIIAVWAVLRWQEAGSPSPSAVMELGPGRGTLMVDFLRTIRKIAPNFNPEIHFVETSESLQKLQKQNVPEATWHKEAPKLNLPTLVIANEFFDALPIKQFINGAERKIIENDGKLQFSSNGEITESSEISEQIMKNLSENCYGGVIVDYGYNQGSGDTLQALQNHKFVSPLENPGEADITAHVNFGNLIKSAVKPCRFMTQREFLLNYGGLERAKALGLEQDFARLADPDQMGQLFKVLCF